MAEAVTLTGRFAQGLLNPTVSTPGHVTQSTGGPVDKRYGVYRNNVTASLVSALGDIFPGLRAMMGEDGFSAMARGHVRRHPPRSPLLFEYGRDLPGFLAAAPQMKATPHLVDLARLERFWLDAFHAADAPVADPQALGAIAPDAVADTRFTAHPATRVLASDHALFDLFAMARGLTDRQPADLNAPQAVLVTRPDIEVIVTGLDHPGAAFVTSLMQGATLGEAAATASSHSDAFDLGAALGLILSTGAFSAITPPAKSMHHPEEDT